MTLASSTTRPVSDGKVCAAAGRASAARATSAIAASASRTARCKRMVGVMITSFRAAAAG